MNLVSLFDGLLKGFQRMDLVNLTLIAVSIPNLLGSYLVLRLGWGILGLVTIACIVYLLQLLLLAVQAKIAFPALAWRRQDLRFAAIKALFGYGIRFQISQVAQMVSYQADKILLGLFVPLRYVTFYDLGAKVSYLLDLPHIMLGAIFPAASALAGKEDQRRLWMLFELGTKCLLLLSVPTLVGTWLTAHLILQVWLGHVLSDVHLAVLLLEHDRFVFVFEDVAIRTCAFGQSLITALFHGLAGGNILERLRDIIVSWDEPLKFDENFFRAVHLACFRQAIGKVND